MSINSNVRKDRVDDKFFSADPLVLAERLLGKRLNRVLGKSLLSGIIVEVEAYLAANDLASHSSRGQTKSNKSMFAEPGTLYVYPIHSRHCLNIVCSPVGLGAAVLIRGLEPICGMVQMAARRNLSDFDHSRVADLRSIGQGPGRLCEALAINRRQDGIDLKTSTEIFLSNDASVTRREWKIRSSKRIGISKAKDLEYRLFVDGNHFVSGCAREHSNGRSWRFADELA